MILVVSATESEIKPTIDWLANSNYASQINVLITGVGIPATMYHLHKQIVTQKPSLVIHVGIAGSYNTDIHIGQVVVVESEQWSDLGVEDNDNFYSIFDLGLEQKSAKPYTHGKILTDVQSFPFLSHLKRVTAITSNTAHGNASSIFRQTALWNPDIESMEGAASAYICNMEMIPFFELRSISNYVEPRDTKKWNIPLAIDILNTELMRLLPFISTTTHYPFS